MSKITILKSGGDLSPSKAAEMLHDGTAHGKKLTDKQRKFFGWKSHQKAEDGATLTPIGSGTSLFKGPSHEQGGIPFSYGGKKVEVEGNETLQEGADGADIMGGMKVPGTTKTFANVSKLLAKKEQKVKNKMQEGADLVKAANPDDKWEILKFNSGEAYLRGGIKKLDEIGQNKEHLTNIQRAMLDHSEELGVDPHEFSKGRYTAAKGAYLGKAKYGKYIPKVQVGWQFRGTKTEGLDSKILDFLPLLEKNGITGYSGPESGISMRNTKSGRLSRHAQKEALDAFINQPDAYQKIVNSPELSKYLIDNGLTIINEYDPTVASKTGATAGHLHIGYDKGTRISDKFRADVASKYKSSNPTWGWGTYRNPKGKTIPGGIKGDQQYFPIDVGSVTEPVIKEDAASRTNTQRVIPGSYTQKFTNPKPNNLPSNAEPLELDQVLPEIYTAATNHEDPVWLQQYNPQLFQPYNVSFQDKLNEQKAQFNGIQKLVGDNPTALATLAGQEYSAASSVLGDEFRTNQAIANDVTNKNISLLNDAQNENLKLADTQYVRQSQAKSNTKAQNFNVLSSISDKLLQREADNRALKVYENLYPDYRFNKETGKSMYGGPNADEWINFPGNIGGGIKPISRYSSQTVKYGPLGTVKETSVSTPSEESIFDKTLRKFKNPNVKKYGGSIVRSFNSYKKSGNNTMKNNP